MMMTASDTASILCLCSPSCSWATWRPAWRRASRGSACAFPRKSSGAANSRRCGKPCKSRSSGSPSWPGSAQASAERRSPCVERCGGDKEEKGRRCVHMLPFRVETWMHMGRLFMRAEIRARGERKKATLLPRHLQQSKGHQCKTCML